MSWIVREERAECERLRREARVLEAVAAGLVWIVAMACALAPDRSSALPLALRVARGAGAHLVDLLPDGRSIAWRGRSIAWRGRSIE